MNDILLVVITSLISGLLATILTLIYQKLSRIKESKIRVFENLMSYRYALYLQESVNELNKIDVVFYRDIAVIQAWKEFKVEASKVANDDIKPNGLSDKHLKVLEAMAKAIGFKRINWEDIKDFYYPNGLASKIQYEMINKSVNNETRNTQISYEQQLGLSMISKIIEHPEAVDGLIKLSETFVKGNNKKESGSKNKNTKINKE